MVDVRVAEPPARWRVVTDSRIGVLTVAGWEVRVKPKLGIPRLMFLLGYSADPRGWRELGPLFDVEDDLFSAIARVRIGQAGSSKPTGGSSTPGSM